MTQCDSPSIWSTRAVDIGVVTDELDRLAGAGCGAWACGLLAALLRTTNPFLSVIQDSTESSMLSSGWRLRGARGGWPGILTIVTWDCGGSC